MASQQTANPGRTQKKRTRTGCLRCRTRRRKCDEHKPRCQRCVDAQAECVYGPRLSFLQKNAFTLSSNNRIDPSPKEESDSSRYSKVQFVDNGSAHQKEIGQNEESQTPIPSSLLVERQISNTYNDSPSRSGPVATPSTTTGEQPGFYLDPNSPYRNYGENNGQSQNAQAQKEASPHLNRDHEDEDIRVRQGDSYEIALDVLMTLGTGDAAVDVLTPVAPLLDDSEEISLSSPPSILKSIDDLGQVSGHVSNQLALERTIELLRHYRYKIAPWLDMCDVRQTFGLVVPHIATRSDISFDAFLKLCAASYATNSSSSIPTDNSTNQSRHSSHLIHPIEHHIEHAKMWEVKLWSVLTATERFLIEPPQLWEDALTKNNFLHMVYTQMAENSPLRVLNERMLWLLARLGIAVALFNEITSTIDGSLLRSLLENSPDGEHKPGNVNLHFAHEPLVLCIEVLEFSFGDAEATRNVNDISPRPRAVRWKSLVDNLNDWYTNRPSTFRPVIELGSEGSPFPVIYFTSGAATFANQLYHTSMMLILAHKPKTLQLDQRRSPSLSQLWHAQRICGIAINNDRCECWDPCLLASFYRGAQRMTHESQHREILLGFDHISTLGWRVGSFVERLKEAWHTSEILARD
ncbi:hypothetical protein V8C35DRAFT_236178 [Trichoderma chlorosporum]